MSDLSRKFMKKNALLDLYAGCVTPWDRNILSDMGLPSDVVDPFASQDTDPLSIMNLTFVSLKGWIEDAKKADYYSERFVDLSKLVMKGVTTMGRGLVTLHKRGEDLSAAPMQIEDLISVGSYHFRKSYLGVVQLSAKHPEIGERLLLNQLRWADMLLRLYKTKEKLSEKPGIRCNRPEIKDSGSDAAQEKLGGQENTAGEVSEASPFDSLDSLFVDRSSSLSSPSSLNEPAAFSAQRALSALDGSKKCGMRKAEAHKASHPAAAPAAQEDRHPDHTNDPRTPKPEENASETETPIKTNEKAQDTQKTQDDQTQKIITKEKNTGHEESPKNFTRQDRSPENQVPDPGPDPLPEENLHESAQSSGASTSDSMTDSHSKEQLHETNQPEIPDPVPDPSPEEQLHAADRSTEISDPVPIQDSRQEEHIHADEPPPVDSPHLMTADSNIPFYLQILRIAFDRSSPNEKGAITFTEDEIIYLARDPDFEVFYPDQAAQMRKILAEEEWN